MFTEDESSARGVPWAACERPAVVVVPDEPPVANEEMSDMTPGMVEDSPLLSLSRCTPG